MEQKKYKLTPDVRTQLRFLRQQSNLAAEDVSVELGKSKAWLAQIERGKLFSIKRNDLLELLKMYTEFSEYDIIHNGVLENFVQTGFAVESAPESKEWYDEIEIIKDYFYHYLNDCGNDNERLVQISYVNALLRCMNDYPGAISLMFENIITLETILENYSSLSHDKYLSKVSSLTKKLSTVLNKALRDSDSL